MERTKSKRAQMEIMGLAIIVILIILGMMFVIQFVVFKQSDETKKTFTQSQVASNLLNTMLRTSLPDCSDTELKQILRDCALHYEDERNRIVCSDSLDSCEFANKTIQYMLNSTLVEWGNQSFNFEARLTKPTDLVIIQQSNGDCTGEKQQKQQYIPISSGNIMEVIVEICD